MNRNSRDIYANWIALVAARERTALHNLIEAVLWILLVLLAVYLADRLIERLFTGVTAENKRVDTLRAVVKFAAQAVGAIAILFIIFGMPTQTTTVLGLAGAGLTVAMKDFIVAFFGWFILMGRNGIRVGDWVEINGVAGEVVEVGLLKTVLLETGSWTDAGHPTGRRVSFVNSFAIEGHFFNFTTSGQWMWDELQITIPADQDPYPSSTACGSWWIKKRRPTRKRQKQSGGRPTRATGRGRCRPSRGLMCARRARGWRFAFAISRAPTSGTRRAGGCTRRLSR